MIRVKICGITSLRDALAAVEFGADALGFVFAPSPRRIGIDAARAIIEELPPFILTVGVFSDASVDRIIRISGRTGVQSLQLHGTEAPSVCRLLRRPVIKRLAINARTTRAALRRSIARYRPVTCLLDPGAGSGVSFDWRLCRSLKSRFIIAGGLDPDNVRLAIRISRPYAVDVCSGVESSPGKKDLAKMRSFIKEVKAC